MEYFTFKLAPIQLNTVLLGLAKLPYEQSAELIAGLQQSANEQMKAAQPSLPLPADVHVEPVPDPVSERVPDDHSQPA